MLSIVIPTLNAEKNLAVCLAGILAEAPQCEIVVSDGDSVDSTVAVAEAAGAVVISETSGRGAQLAAGAIKAKGPWLLFLHADSALDNSAQVALASYIEWPGNTNRAGYFGFAFFEAGFKPWLWRWAVALRCKIFALPYGDQGLLIHRELYDRIGGYRHLVLMEDVDLVRRLGRRRLINLPGLVKTSAVRFESRGYLRQAWLNFRLVRAFWRGVDPDILYQQYLKN